MSGAYPGEIKYVICPLCGARVKLICNRMWQWEGTCPQCHKLVIE